MDEKDRKILDILRKNGRASFTDIANKIDVSEGTVRNRVNNMKEEGVIQRFTVKLNKSEVSATVMAKISTDINIEDVLKSFPSDLEIEEVTGDYDLIIRLSRKNNEELNNTLDDIRNVRGIEETKTYSVLKHRDL